MKYGLFAPLHKVSRPGASPVSRPGSVRGTPLCRSSSRDSLSSSVSNSSRASRVRLGITSLTSAQVIIFTISFIHLCLKYKNILVITSSGNCL